MNRPEFSELFQSYRSSFETFLKSRTIPLLSQKSAPELFEAMKYSLTAGGKRLRPVLAAASYGDPEQSKKSSDVLYLGSALECIHTYSLIHDDLPCMDDDDFRRGIPTLHKKFPESTAILAGDALNSFAFFLISKVEVKEEDRILHSNLLEILHAGSGAPGMVSGQIYDLQMERENESTSFNGERDMKELLHTTHRLKTGALIRSSLLLGNRLRPDWKDREELLSRYGDDLGLMFQITDDILDVEGTQENLGKTPGKDEKSGKITFPLLYGIDSCKAMVHELQDRLSETAGSFSSSPEEKIFFQELPEYIGQRKN
ncbi:polyprenyl synthetase family protein [Leptospira gomenensis]|uniref:Polyprenyl synthetase family protein n=1 Tax=Leptospira gomenensis TaxID=2484974 RepID=A0A5F1YPE4_9LEPT|nr:polyprenyl synthetase family protein [Leptospira gomenensis]TGK32744.1 polyprenyl synthetase family protein [Leptospira gomenensis]TGK36891.1 polyprenyl synthetase family protein [Leptospira gomenensis]TGK44363.1 polyprenyl synthetase family protein [Leptospira gomenensis]TGK58856.1 polyprenyl synthetase family protein [Leptospira gomenensis]